MTVVYCSEGLIATLNILTVGGGGSLTVCLFGNDFFPAPDSVLSDFAPPTFSGYNCQPCQWALPFVNDLDQAEVDGDPILWQVGPGGAAPSPVYGYFVICGDGLTVLLAERFNDAPREMSSLGDYISLAPSLAVSACSSGGGGSGSGSAPPLEPCVGCGPAGGLDCYLLTISGFTDTADCPLCHLLDGSFALLWNGTIDGVCFWAGFLDLDNDWSLCNGGGRSPGQVFFLRVQSDGSWDISWASRVAFSPTYFDPYIPIAQGGPGTLDCLSPGDLSAFIAPGPICPASGGATVHLRACPTPILYLCPSTAQPSVLFLTVAGSTCPGIPDGSYRLTYTETGVGGVTGPCWASDGGLACAGDVWFWLDGLGVLNYQATNDPGWPNSPQTSAPDTTHCGPLILSGTMIAADGFCCASISEEEQFDWTVTT